MSKPIPIANLQDSDKTLQTYSENAPTEYIAAQIDAMCTASAHYNYALQNATEAKVSADKALAITSTFFKNNTKEAVEALQKATDKLLISQISSLSAIRAGLLFTQQLSQTTKSLFLMGVSNTANTRCIIRELENKLHGGQGSQISPLARTELDNLLKQLKEQEDINNRQQRLFENQQCLQRQLTRSKVKIEEILPHLRKLEDHRKHIDSLNPETQFCDLNTKQQCLDRDINILFQQFEKIRLSLNDETLTPITRTVPHEPPRNTGTHKGCSLWRKISGWFK